MDLGSLKNVFKNIMLWQYNKDRSEVNFVGKIWTRKQKKNEQKKGQMLLYLNEVPDAEQWKTGDNSQCIWSILDNSLKMIYSHRGVH